MAEKNGVKRTFIIIGMVLLGIVLCYFSVAMYFYYGRPYDISGKLSVWNLMSDSEIGEMYLDATYDVQYGEEERFVGVNVDEGGYVVTCHHKFSNYNGETIYLYASSGEVYNGDIVFSSEIYNLVILKVRTLAGDTSVRLPYVSTGGVTSSFFGTNYLAIGSPSEEGNINTVNTLHSTVGYVTTTFDQRTVVDFVCTDSVMYTIENYESTSQGAIFDKTGKLIGLTYAYAVDETSADYYAVTLSQVRNIIKKLKNDEIVKFSIEGFDFEELSVYYDFRLSETQVFVGGKWVTLSGEVLKFYQNGAQGIYLTEDFTYNSVTLGENNIITSISYNGYSKAISSRKELCDTLYSLDKGTVFTLTSTNLTTNSVVRTQFSI